MTGGHETESYMQRTTLKLDKTILRIQVVGNTIRVLQAKLK